MSETALLRTPLYNVHVDAGARMVPFAGYEMPVQYKDGIMAEHKWTREHAGLFDVSHMGQCFVQAAQFEQAARTFEKILPCDVLGLEKGQIRYSQLLNKDGGIIDDLMISRSLDHFNPNGLEFVVNASRTETDLPWIAQHLPEGIVMGRYRDRALMALQGPSAEQVLGFYCPEVRDLKFMQQGYFATIHKIPVHVWRSGYTGEDGFEISIEAKHAEGLWSILASHQEVKAVGLGARDSLRLEAGLCLYGHDIDETTSPIEADLAWSIAKRRRAEGGFIGAERVLREIADGVRRKRVGIRPEGRAPAREGSVVQDMTGRAIGRLTSGGFGPTVNGPVAMGYVETAFAVPGTSVQLVVRDKILPAVVTKLPFVPNRFKR